MNNNEINSIKAPSPASKKWYLHKGVWAIGVLVLLVAVASVLYFKRSAKEEDNFYLPGIAVSKYPLVKDPNDQPQATTTTSTPPVVEATSTPEPKMKFLLGDTYQLFAPVPNEPANYDYLPTVEYQEDGVISSGKYQGYHRLAAAYIYNDGPDSLETYIFATKDYKTYVVGTYTNGNAYLFNSAKVLKMDDLPWEHPLTIDEGNFILTREYVNWGSHGSTELVSNVPGLKFFDEPVGILDGSASSIQKPYFMGRTTVAVEDAYGLAYDYDLESKELYKRHLNAEAGAYAEPFYEAGDFTAQSSMYDRYGQLLPSSGCEDMGTSVVLKNISYADVTQIGKTSKGVVLYSLRDVNHNLNKAAYSNKVTDEPDFSDRNESVTPPTYSQYVANNPILLFQDPWLRWVGLEENDYHKECDGAGKPVVYLYPTKPTEVSVKLLTPIDFKVTIPSYSEKWDVMANPDGELKDLQPEKTDCNKIDYGYEGSEYARDACTSGVYPYLYWAGQVAAKYPAVDKGWVVAKDDVGGFLDKKLDEVGLNAKEKADMVEFWVPELLKKNAPYYRLSFFQAETMNKFVPMEITPKPDTLIRVFLDWSPLDAKPEHDLLPQHLTKIDRTGFTAVEWGGLKQ
jgi:hypothetical protein